MHYLRVVVGQKNGRTLESKCYAQVISGSCTKVADTHLAAQSATVQGPLPMHVVCMGNSTRGGGGGGWGRTCNAHTL